MSNPFDIDAARAIVAPPIPRASFTLQPKQYQGPKLEDVLSQRQQHLSAGQYHFYKVPLMLVEASMQYCFDDKGRAYVDGYSNVCHVGHCHPHFVASTQAAMQNIISNTRYLHPTIGKYAERLKSKLPSSLSVCYFVNSGSEANDLAMRLARVHTKKHGVICLEHAYHGTTLACTGVSTSLSTGTLKGGQDYEYAARDVFVAPVPDTYRGKYRADDPDAGRKYAKAVKDIIDANPHNIAAFIHESVQGVGGQIVYPRDYLQHVYKHVRAANGVVIADEVQTGFGRTGTHFWAFEPQGVVPDILVMGKPIGNGFPLGAVVCTREIAHSFDGVQYFNTNGGNPVACAAGLAVLEIIERDSLQQNALAVSLHFMALLQTLKEKHKIIGDVRGVGLFVGIELVRSHETLAPAADETAEAMERCKAYGLLVGKGGYHNNVLRLKPPLCFTKTDAEFACRVLDCVFTDIAKQGLLLPTRNSKSPLGESDTYVQGGGANTGRRIGSARLDEISSLRNGHSPRNHRDADTESGRLSARVLANVPRALAAHVENGSGKRGRRSHNESSQQAETESDDERDGRRRRGSAFALR